MPQGKRNQPAGKQSDSSQQSGTDRSSSREPESTVNRESSDRSSVSSRGDRSAQRENRRVRDHQQIADENEQSGVVDTEEVRNRASEMEQAEGSRENAGGISNRDLGEERENQSRVPRRGESREDESA
jgi:hypothetical protein